MKKTFALVLCVALMIVAIASGCQRENEVNKGVVKPYDITNNPDGMGGSGEECTIHSPYYHIIPGEFDNEAVKNYINHSLYDYKASPGDCVEAMCTIVDFVQWSGISREEFIEAHGWSEEEMDEIYREHNTATKRCPYTINQYLDAIYGDDPELAEWVFAGLSTWPEIEEPAE
ncbi:MAG: hypothetical protein IIX28_00025 [Clostridia bacterium]|nr:hypothetical protein [Clostridia bacterium]